MIAVVPVRSGTLPSGGEESIAEAGGRALLFGDGAIDAARQLVGSANELLVWETPGFKPAAWAAALAPRLENEEAILLPSSPDGRDLAPRLAYTLGRPLFANAITVERQERAGSVEEEKHHRLVVTEYNRQIAREIQVSFPFVATLQPGVRGVDPTPRKSSSVELEILELEISGAYDADLIEVLPADPATVDLSEAQRIMSGGLGLGDEEVFRQLQKVALDLNASFAGTRAAADRGWLPTERFVGATGIQVNPDLYVALGISGAIQHVSGLGRPKHIIAVNVDAGCPMMALADLAIVCDAPAVIRELALHLDKDRTGRAEGTGQDEGLVVEVSTDG